MQSGDEQYVAARIARVRRRRRVCLAAARVGLAGLALLGLVAMISFAAGGSVPSWMSVAWSSLVVGVGCIWLIVMFTACSRCGSDPNGDLARWPSPICKVCGTELAPERELR